MKLWYWTAGIFNHSGLMMIDQCIESRPNILRLKYLFWIQPLLSSLHGVRKHIDMSVNLSTGQHFKNLKSQAFSHSIFLEENLIFSVLNQQHMPHCHDLLIIFFIQTTRFGLFAIKILSMQIGFLMLKKGCFTSQLAFSLLNQACSGPEILVLTLVTFPLP